MNLPTNFADEATLETSFGKIETLMPETLKALDEAAKQQTSPLPVYLYENLSNYCAFLYTLSPVFKAFSPRLLVEDLTRELLEGDGELIQKYFDMSEATKNKLKKGLSDGKQIIISSADYIQPSHRIQLKRYIDNTSKLFRFCTKWTLCNSPIDLPISDVAIIVNTLDDFHIHALPISPRLLLVGEIAKLPLSTSDKTDVETISLSLDEA